MIQNAADPARANAPHRTLQRFVALSLLVHGALLFGFVVPHRAPSADPMPALKVSIAPRADVEAIMPQRNNEPPPKVAAQPIRSVPTPAPAARPVLTAPPAASAAPPEARPTAVAEPVPNHAAGPTMPSPPANAPSTPVEPVARVAATPAAPERRGKPSTLWLAEYTQVMTTQVARVKTYPQIARLRGWEGTTVVMVQLAPDGTILDARVAQSSGHDVLDRQAISMVRRAEPMPPLPTASAGGSDGPLEVRLPIVFALAARD